jgi:hypothetical protein
MPSGIDEGFYAPIRVMVNDEGFLRRDERAARKLKDGDHVRLMLPSGGG